MLLGLIAAAVLSFGLSAGAAPDGASGESELEAAQRHLAELRIEEAAARAAHDDAVIQMGELETQIAATARDLEAAEADLAEAQRQLQELAAQMYTSGNVGFVDVLVGAKDFSEFANQLQVWVDLVEEQGDALNDLLAARDSLAEQKAELENQRNQQAATLADADAQVIEAQGLEDEAQAYLDSLNAQLREELEAEQARQAELAREAGEELAAELAADQAAADQAAKGQAAADQAAVDQAAADQAAAAAQQADLAAEAAAAREADREAELRAAQLYAEQKAEEEEQARIAAEQAAAEGKADEEKAEELQALVDETKFLAEQAEEQEAARAAEEEQARLAAQEQARLAAQKQAAADQAAADQAAADQAVAEQLDGLPAASLNDAGGVVGKGAQLRVEGDFSISPGASVTLQDADGTTGTATDGLNAGITEGSIVIDVTASLSDVTGGDGQLATEGLQVVDMTGIVAGAAGDAQYEDGQSGDLAGGATTPEGTTSTTPEGTTAADDQYDDSTTGAATGAMGAQPAATATAGGTTAGAGTGSASDVVAESATHMGTPYVFSPPGPCENQVGEDCSCHTMLVYAAFGISLPDSPAAQYGMGAAVSGAPAAGDLVFWAEGGGITHVGIATGNGTTIHASAFEGVVTETPMDAIPGYVGARRLL
jgi:cell wall-associated NlpC family hydrolase/peptidoglycan hydrolase CwlO-like protein